MRTATSLFLFLCPLLVLADHAHDARQHRRHKQRAELSRLESRGSRATFYDVGLGACGKTNSGDEHVIALNAPQWDGGSHCFEMVSVSFGGKTTQAQIVDECMGCPWGGIDMSRGLFEFFSSESAGVISVDWNFGGGEEPKPTSSKPKPSPKPKPTSTSSSSTWSASSTSSTSSTTTSSTSTSTSSTSSSSVASSYSTPIPSPTPVPAGPQNLIDLNSLVAALGKLVVNSGK